MRPHAPRRSISEFAHACGLTPKALRLYDEMGLLPPAEVDDVTGTAGTPTVNSTGHGWWPGCGWSACRWPGSGWSATSRRALRWPS
ncbi:MAG: MerR family DNA-binding transcriptional regulator [Nocardioides sp.]|nr:MerR family DNA-binding transcriptional regulator [Nocardioides sp.]